MNYPRVSMSKADKIKEIRRMIYSAELQLADSCPGARDHWVNLIASYRQHYRSTITEGKI